jgi:hypothetical protein
LILCKEQLQWITITDIVPNHISSWQEGKMASLTHVSALSVPDTDSVRIFVSLEKCLFMIQRYNIFSYIGKE